VGLAASYNAIRDGQDMLETTPAPDPASFPRDTRARLALVLALVVLGAALLRLGSRALALLRSPFSRDYGEGCVLGMLQLLAEKGNYFTRLDQYPMVHGNYPPLFLLLNVPFYHLFGPTLFYPRLLSLLSTLGVGCLVFWILRRRTGQAAYALLFALVLACPWYVRTWAALARVDMLACFLSLAGLAVFDSHGERPGRGRYLAFSLFWLAFFTKQNALLAPAAALLSLLFDRERRSQFPRAALTFLVPLLAGFGLLALVTQGEAFRHLVPYTAAADYEWDRMARSYRDFLGGTGPLLLLAVFTTVRLGRRAIFADVLFELYLLLNLLGLVTIAKAGAAQNYFIEPFLAALLCGALGLHRLTREGPSLPAAWPAALLVVAAVALASDFEKGQRRQAVEDPQEVAEFRELQQAVRTAPGPVLSENLTLSVLAHRPVLVEAFGYSLISRRGLVSTERLVADCEAGQFALVVLEFRLGDIPGMDACLSRRYLSWKRLGPYELLRPRPVP
jgi:4-amino-4-deoxy-L-arabinose transferase-like glycosyltransferase